MGLILDSSVLVAAERRGRNARQALTDIAGQFAGEDVAISVISLMEMAHGAARADSPERGAVRWQFLQELASVLPVYPVSPSVALRAGQIDGESTAKGVRIALADLLIGVTALQLGYQLATMNVRHFRSIPGLSILSL